MLTIGHLVVDKGGLVETGLILGQDSGLEFIQQWLCETHDCGDITPLGIVKK